MAAIPALAPVGRNHLLGSTSVVTRVAYGHNEITYRTYDADAGEVLRLAFTPRSITAGGHVLHRESSLRGAGYTVEALADGDFVVRIHHMSSGNVAIRSRLQTLRAEPASGHSTAAVVVITLLVAIAIAAAGIVAARVVANARRTATGG